jgi:hypothetical protein
MQNNCWGTAALQFRERKIFVFCVYTGQEDNIPIDLRSVCTHTLSHSVKADFKMSLEAMAYTCS